MIRTWMLVLAAAALLPAQEQPQLVWEGQVDGISILRARGNRIDLEDREGLPVQRQRHRFYERLPENRQNVRLEVREGRGQVRILEQPRLENNYTLAVSIEDRQGGSAFYSLAFYWETARGFLRPQPRPSPSSYERMESLTWNGGVDGEAIVSCWRDTCEAEARRGGLVSRDRFRFTRALPAQDVVVSLERTEGRGEIRLIQQPRDENSYTAQVLIRDPQGGTGDYSFSLAWARPSREDAGGSLARRGLIWSGRVDGRVRVIVEGNEARSEAIGGAPVTAERAEFARMLPRRNNPNATVRRLRGRGRVEILEYPSNRNNYRLVFEIDDTSGGADQYQIEIGW